MESGASTQASKHVWEAGGWPFPEPELNNRVVTAPHGRVFFLRRRNLLRRLVSTLISKQLNFWIGTRLQFLARVQGVELQGIDPAWAADEIRRDHRAVLERLRLFERCGTEVRLLDYEALFDERASNDTRRATINGAFEFLGVSPIDPQTFDTEFFPLFDPDTHRWSSPEIYRLIPGIDRVESQVGSDETGWLFRG